MKISPMVIKELHKIREKNSSNLYRKSENGKTAKRLKDVAKLKAKLSLSSSIGLKVYSRIKKSFIKF